MTGIYWLLAHLTNNETSSYHLYVSDQMIYKIIPIWEIITDHDSQSGKQRDYSEQYQKILKTTFNKTAKIKILNSSLLPLWVIIITGLHSAGADDKIYYFHHAVFNKYWYFTQTFQNMQTFSLTSATDCEEV